MKKLVLSSLILFLSLLGILLLNKYIYQTSEIKKEAMRCPDVWIENRMPSVWMEAKKMSNEYFIVDGKRRELAEYDMSWIKNYCNLKAEVVY